MRIGRRLRSPIAAGVFALACVAVITLVFAGPLEDVPPEVSALLLLVPITVASVLSSWRVGLPVALIAGLLYGFVILPPFGTFRIGYTEEATITITFTAVAIVVSILVSRRSIANRADLIGRERMMLLRSVSHDLRNPLNSILGAATELSDGADYDAQGRQRLLGIVIDETRRLDRIVDNLLGLSRLQAGALDPRREPVAVADVVEQCESRFGLIGGLGDRLEIAEPLPDVDVDIDPVQIDQVLTNLVENAVRHAGPRVCITVGASANDGVVEWFVHDDGPGLSPSAREAAFEPFHPSRPTSGLGLAMCRAIVEAHDGMLWIDAEPTPRAAGVADLAASGGTTIRFTVPRA